MSDDCDSEFVGCGCFFVMLFLAALAGCMGAGALVWVITVARG